MLLVVQRVEQLGVTVADHVALDFQRGGELPALDREVVIEDRELLDLLHLGVVVVGPVELVLDELEHLIGLGQLVELLR